MECPQSILCGIRKILPKIMILAFKVLRYLHTVGILYFSIPQGYYLGIYYLHIIDYLISHYYLLLMTVKMTEADKQIDSPIVQNFISVSFTIIYKMSTSISIPPASHINSRYTAIIVATRVVTHKHSKDNFLRDLWRHGHKYPTEILATFPLKMTNRRSSPFWNAFIRYFRNIFFLLLSFSLWCLFFFRVSQKSSSPWLVMDDGNLQC